MSKPEPKPPLWLRLLRSRDFLLLAALAAGLAVGGGARYTEAAVLPLLAVVMTLATMGVEGRVFRSPRSLATPFLAGLLLNFVVLGGMLLVLSSLLISDRAFVKGFIILAAAPPAVAVIPFAVLLRGNSSFALIGAIGCYLGALIIMPVTAVAFLGMAVIQPWRLLIILLQLILAPLMASRVLLWTGASQRLEPVKGTLTNWSFFLISYTIVGLNRDLFLYQTLSLAPVALIALASTFALGAVIAAAARRLGADPPTVVSLVLLGTLKNYALAGGLALTLFDRYHAVPAAVSTVFMIVYIIWLGFKGRRLLKRER
jgi:bile acid:Na+ symporter, BASS family